MAHKFTRWRVSLAACVVGSSLGVAGAQQPTLAPPQTDQWSPVLTEAAAPAVPLLAAEPAAPAVIETEDEYDYTVSEASEPRADAESYDSFDEPALVSQPAAKNTAPAPGAVIETIKERFPDGAVHIEREVTQDALGNYVNHGSWTMYDRAGTMVAEGHYVNDLRDGVWHRWYRRDDAVIFSSLPYNQFQEPFVSEATFKNGQLNGTWTIYDAKQRKVSEWEFTDGQRNGASTWYYVNGRKLREANYRDGALHGEMVEWDSNGQPTIRDSFQDGRKIATKTTYYPNSKKKQAEGMYLFAKIVPKTADDWWNAKPAEFTVIGKDERHGAWTSWYSNGQKQMTGEFRNDVEVGKFTWWYPNGQKATEGQYKIGKPDGEWVWWHPNGQKATAGSYALGNPVGRWSGWDETGRLTRAEDHSGHQRLESRQVTEEPPRAAQNNSPSQPRQIFK